jgi:RpiR family carbohydrate utilization transcriptional regulator
MNDAMPAARAGRSDFLHRLAELAPALRPAERRVADFVLRDPARVPRMNLATLAAEAGVSQPTAIRFARTAGCDGIPDLKIRIAQSVAVGAPYVHAAIDADDDLDAIADKVCASSVDTLQRLRAQLDMQAVGRAVEATAAARRIDLIGIGHSGVAALDAQQKFMRLGVPATFHGDSHLQRMSVATLTPRDVVMVFSYTGEIRTVVRTAEMARAQGATVIGVTRSDSALAPLCHIVIGVDTLEDTFVYAPMMTRLAHLVVIDVLATAVALRSGPQGLAVIRRVKGALRDEWLINPVSAEAAEPDP